MKHTIEQYAELVKYIIQRGNVRICLKCGGSNEFASSIQRWTYYCNKCELVWVVTRMIEKKNPLPRIYYIQRPNE